MIATASAASSSSRSSRPERFRIGLLPDVLRVAYLEWQEDKAARLSAAFAYYAVFSLAPLLIVAITIAGAVFGEQAAQGQIKAQIEQNVGAEAASAIQSMIEAASKSRGTGVRASIVGILISLWGASNLFAQLQDSLNTIWEVAPKPSQGLWIVVRQRFLSFSVVLSIGFMFLVSLLASAAIAAATGLLGERFALSSGVLQALNFGVLLLLSVAMFGFIYKVLPDAEVQWRDVWIGAALTAFLFGLGRLLLGLYLGRSGVSSAYGAAGSLIVILLWVYYASQILFFGAEFTRVYANRFGSKVRPAENAVPATDAMREQQGLPRLGDLQATEIAQDAVKDGQPIRSSEPFDPHAGQAQKKAPAPLQVLAGVLKKSKGEAGSSDSSDPSVPSKPISPAKKADRDYLFGAALGFAAILLLALRRDKDE